MSKRSRGSSQFDDNDYDDDDATQPQVVAKPDPSTKTDPSSKVDGPKKSPPAAKRAKPAKPPIGFVALNPFPGAGTALGDPNVRNLVWALIGVGILVRAVRYLLNFPLWPDEAYLAHNFLNRSYADLMQPLDYHQVAPLLYLWLQKSVIFLFGFSEYTLRLTVFLASIGSLFLFRSVAMRLLNGLALLFAVGTFAVAYPLIRYSAEAKPYGIDMFVALALIALLVEWRARPEQTRWWWALALAMPLAILFSYPAAFVTGAVIVAMALVLVWRGTLRAWCAWLLVNAMLAGGVAILYYVSGHGQFQAASDFMRGCWDQTFPPLHSPAKLAMFLLLSNTSEALAYPVGGVNGTSALTTIFCLSAMIYVLRAKQISLAALCAMPLILNFTAAALHCYPYAGQTRFMLFMAPLFCLLAGLGAAVWIGMLYRVRWSAQTPVYIGLGLLIAVGLGASVRDFLKPYKETCWQRNRDFARWFWSDKAQGAELVCLQNDLKQCFFSPAEGDDLAAVYFCNQRIYSPRLAHAKPADMEHATRACPLRCARFRPAKTTLKDDNAFAAWLQEFQAKYQMVGMERYPLTFFVHEKELKYVDLVEVFEFVGREQPAYTANHAAPAIR